jgi:NAD(P)-dependent dehydrogenase (short-subunit alcohol dehydrogenase family)
VGEVQAGHGAILNVSSMAAESHFTRNIAFDLGPKGMPQDIENAALFLCSPAAAWEEAAETTWGVLLRELLHRVPPHVRGVSERDPEGCPQAALSVAAKAPGKRSRTFAMW